MQLSPNKAKEYRMELAPGEWGKGGHELARRGNQVG